MATRIEPQVLYLGRWVSKDYFCAFVYNSTGQRLVKNYDEFTDLISSGIWFAEKKENYDEDNVVEIKSKRGRKCQSQQQA